VDVMEVSGKRKVGPSKTNENLERYNEEGFGTNMSVALDRARLRKIIASPTPI